MGSENPSERREAAAALTRLLVANPSFSFLRLGDGETQWMVSVLRGHQPEGYHYFDTHGLSLERAVGTRGLEDRYFNRLVTSYLECDYVDYCEEISEANRRNQAEIRLPRSPSKHRNPSPKVSNIIFDWAYHELGPFISQRRCLFASAEAALMRELFADEEYRTAVERYIPRTAVGHFHQVRDNGRNYSQNLELIKQDLMADIRRHRIEVLFLSLGTGAKILCHELAIQCGLRAIDWGAMSRALTYCGSPGYHAVRSDHTPFFVRVPFRTYMDALLRAHPDLPAAAVLLKAQCQLALDLQKKKFLSTSPADVNAGGAVDLSTENLAAFWDGYRAYRAVYRPISIHDAEARRLDAEFRSWRWKQGLGLSGRVFRGLVWLKRVGRRSLAAAARLAGASGRS